MENEITSYKALLEAVQEGATRIYIAWPLSEDGLDHLNVKLAPGKYSAKIHVWYERISPYTKEWTEWSSSDWKNSGSGKVFSNYWHAYAYRLKQIEELKRDKKA